MGRILIKLGENVGTSVRLIILKFHKNRFRFDIVMIWRHPIFKVFFKGNNSSQSEATLLKEKKTLSKGMIIMLRQTVTQATAIFLLGQEFDS